MIAHKLSQFLNELPPSPVFISIAVLIVYTLYCWLLPKPIPGIPYNKNAVKTILGDIPSFIESQKQGISIWRWTAAQSAALQSPIIQVWLRPFSRPVVIVADFREAEDISLRRTKDFDRSNSLDHIFTPVFPEFHMLMKTNTPSYKRQRKWLQDLMTPAFLHDVAAEPIYQHILKITKLWDHKLRLAQGHPFAAFDDIYYGALDAVLAFSFGNDFAHMATPARLNLISSLQDVARPSEPDAPVVFPEEKKNEVVDAVLTLAESVEGARGSVAPRIWSWYKHQTMPIKTAKKIRDGFINNEINASLQRQENGEAVTSAVDHIMHRERLFAKKEGRPTMYKSGGMHSEIFGFLMAGHETSATTFAWGVKYLTDNQEAQNKLRMELRRHMEMAATEKRQPTTKEILKSKIPYLDATLEEILRCAGTTSVTDRQAMRDTTIMGRYIPKDTNVVLLGIGESIMKPAFNIPDSNRTETALAAASRIRSWESSPYPESEFRPERWLMPSEESGEMVYDATSGPHLAFGLGPRACFGRRLAYLELRMFTVLFFWNFELLPCAPELSSYKGMDGLTVKPRYCYVRLAKSSWETG